LTPRLSDLLLLLDQTHRVLLSALLRLSRLSHQLVPLGHRLGQLDLVHLLGQSRLRLSHLSLLAGQLRLQIREVPLDQ
jgi:hypothetical protein